MVTLALALLLAQTPQHRLFLQPNLPQGPDFAFFEAFPANGAGTSGACSTTPPTGARGEVLSMTRGSTATCSKQGPATTGILDGDLVVLSANVARVSSVSGLLAYLRESGRTNMLLRSESIDNAGWTKGGAVGTITANYATAPDGTPTADRYQYSNTMNDYVLQNFNVDGLAATGSVYLKGTSGSGTIYLCRGGAVSQCVTCSYVSTSWSRCIYAATLATSDNLFIGCESTLGGACAQTGLDVLVWGFQGEVGAWASSYIPTVAAGVARSADSALSATLSASVGPTFSLGVSTAYVSASVTTATAVQLGTAAPDLASVGRSTNTAAAFTIDSTSTTPAVAAMGTAFVRGCLTDASGTRTAWWEGATVSAPADSMSAGSAAFSFGALDAYTARVLVDPTATRCP